MAKAAWRALPRSRVINAVRPDGVHDRALLPTQSGGPRRSATRCRSVKPIENTTAYVLDRHRTLMPIGVPGELYVGGDGVAAGYWRRPELTAERFVPDPFVPGGRLYRTGDVACYREDGEHSLPRPAGPAGEAERVSYRAR